MILSTCNFMLFFLGFSICSVYAHFVFPFMFFLLEFSDETWLNDESTKFLEKGTIECRNVGIDVLWQN